DAVFLDHLRGLRDRGLRVGRVVLDDQLDLVLTADHVRLGEPGLDRGFEVRAVDAERPRVREEHADLDGLGATAAPAAALLAVVTTRHDAEQHHHRHGDDAERAPYRPALAEHHFAPRIQLHTERP